MMVYGLIIIVLMVIGLCDAKTYENYTLFRGLPIKVSHLEFFQNLSATYDVNYWRMPGSLRMPVEFLIGPNEKESFLREANTSGIDLTTIMENVQSAFDKQTVKTYSRKQMETFGWNNFYRTKDIYDWLYDLERAFPSEVQVVSIGKTHENRDILAVKVILQGSLFRSKVIIEGGIHAREWISPAFVTFMLHRILYSSLTPNSLLRKIALTYEWYFIPVLNPDGYEHTFTTNRLWRKNRNGEGVDLNRNFGSAFGTEGVSFVRNSEIYCGDSPFSEKESEALAKFISLKHVKLEFYLAFHSYGQFIVIPYAHSSKHLDNYREVHEMCLKTARRIHSIHNKWYTVGTAFDTVGYKVSGASTCWAKKTFSIPYAVTFELRDRGNFGFALPVEQILPTCEETLKGLLVFLTPKTQAFQQMKKNLKVERENVDAHGQTLYLVKIVIVSLPLFIIMNFY